MRIRSGHKPEDWIECPPANPGAMPIRGSLVVGASGPNDSARHLADQKRYLAKLADNRLEGTAANLQNQGVESTIPEVQS